MITVQRNKSSKTFLKSHKNILFHANERALSFLPIDKELIKTNTRKIGRKVENRQ